MLQEYTGLLVSIAGGTLNAGSDWYKAGAKAAGAGMVTTGPYTYSLRPNYFADWIRRVRSSRAVHVQSCTMSLRTQAGCEASRRRLPSSMSRSRVFSMNPRSSL